MEEEWSILKRVLEVGRVIKCEEDEFDPSLISEVEAGCDWPSVRKGTRVSWNITRGLS